MARDLRGIGVWRVPLPGEQAHGLPIPEDTKSDKRASTERACINTMATTVLFYVCHCIGRISMIAIPWYTGLVSSFSLYKVAVYMHFPTPEPRPGSYTPVGDSYSNYFHGKPYSR